MTPASRVADLLGTQVASLRPLHGGSIAEVSAAELADGRRVVVKAARPGQPEFGLEVRMLEVLAAAGMPVPQVLAHARDLLVLEYIDSDGGMAAAAPQAHLARLMAHLHGQGEDRFGFACDTLIGPLPQPNPWTESWIAFFRDQRLLPMAAAARAAGRLPAPVHARIERLATRLGDLLTEPDRASLLHGDLWSGNVLVRGGRVVALLDPAVYYGHAEIELAFGTLFGPFERPFFAHYAERRRIAPGFMEVRRDLYNLYPLLVHVRLFGAAYLGPVVRTLDRHVA